MHTNRWTPLHGWSFEDNTDTYSGPASNDRYGALYQHLRNTLSRFGRRVAPGTFNFRFTGVDAGELSKHVGGMKFDRVEVSHMS
jgi:hypothetical protein